MLRRRSVILAIFFLGITYTDALGQNPVPFVNQPLVPTAVAPGGPDFVLTVNGTGFVSSATVDWNGAPLTTTFVSGSQLTANVPASNIASPGTVSITVTNPAPGGGRSDFAPFAIPSPSTAPLALRRIESQLAGGLAISADFDGDGRVDIAVMDQLNDTAWTAFGNGGGTFGVATSYAAGDIPTWVIAADFNGDGYFDLTTAHWDCSRGSLAPAESVCSSGTAMEPSSRLWTTPPLLVRFLSPQGISTVMVSSI